ncbi:hypothetical protein TRFO_35839 [Tritrichomonas foetus]|uniref:Uncharacterized protein n=1 Tax=Tritrichomonas foetus TaxID=1144522 RepID=A0A1J4JK16_9EUKA|nr:hypothetical protein TRFO_35839 [Tritrichomonas foetus]|eukprot:OHS97875.1 hypothetical protein TRFO_35839 [Tritrichomonas foetus]
MSHNSSRAQQNQQNLLPEFFYDHKLNDLLEPNKVVYDVIEDLVRRGGEILYMKYIQSQICPYASRTLARELVMNASWASFPLDSNDVEAEPDEDLAIPLIDEWAGGVLPVRGSDASGLRVSVTPQREIRKPPTASHRPRTQLDQIPENKTTMLSSRSIAASTKRSKSKQAQRNTKQAPTLTEAQIITNAFEEAKKKTSITMKAVTVDSDFSVIQIQEPKGLPPALIVPKVTTKKPNTKPTKGTVNIPRITRPVVQQRDSRQKKKRVQVKFIEPDVPVFDDEVAEISFSDRFVCAPGVTLKDGSIVKTRPPIVNNEQMTRSQYEQYLEDLKKGGDENQ